MKAQKILIIGHIKGHFRSQLFIQKLIHRDIGGSLDFILTIANPQIFKVPNCRSRLLKYLFNLINTTFFIIEVFIKMPFSNKIYFMAMNHKSFPLVLLINMIWRRPIIADMYISIYDATKDRNHFKGNFFKRLLNLRFEWYYKLLDRLLIEKPDKTIFIGALELELISKVVHADIHKSDYVIIPPASLVKKLSNPSNSESFRICWWGIYLPLHGVENIIKAARLLKTANIRFTIDFFGTQQFNGENYKILANKLDLNHELTFHVDKTFGNGLLEEYLISKCDLALGNFSSTERAQRAIPTKIIDSFSMCLPILTMRTIVLQQVVDIYNELFTSGIKPEEICKEIIAIRNNKQEKDRRARNGYLRYEKTFSVNAVQEKFIELFR